MDAKSSSLPSKVSAHPRPLSPHLGIYRWQLHMAMSILHRMTGVGLALSSPVLAAWLWSVAYSPEMFECITTCLKSLPGQLALFAWTFAFYYHLANGIRHLIWDTGRGYALDTVTRTGIIVIVSALILTAATWICVYTRLSDLHGGIAL